MHILIDVGFLFLVVLAANTFLLRLAPRGGNWSQRRTVQLLVLALPLVSLVLLAGGLVHVLVLRRSVCSPWWDHVLDVTLLVALGAMLLGALLLGGLRLILMKRLMQQRELLMDSDLQTRVDAWTQSRGMNPVRVRLCLDTHPLALIYGVRRPTALLSTWMVEQLDEAELEAVLTHELVHVSRGDYLVNWMATILRDAFCYLPTSRRAYQQFRREKELACDDVVAQTTQKPLALASALTKVWLHLVERPHQSSSTLLAQQLIRRDEHLSSRVNRLLTPESLHDERASSRSSSRRSVSFGIVFMMFVTSIIFLIAEMTCWPGPWF